MWRTLAVAIRDIALFLTGIGLLVKELASKAPDPLVVEIGAAMAGVPGLLHHLALRTGSTSEPVPLSQPLDSPPTDTSNSS